MIFIYIISKSSTHRYFYSGLLSRHHTLMNQENQGNQFPLHTKLVHLVRLVLYLSLDFKNQGNRGNQASSLSLKTVRPVIHFGVGLWISGG